MQFKYQQNKAMFDSVEVIKEADAEFGRIFGRTYSGMVEEYRLDDAEFALITLGSVTGNRQGLLLMS